MPHMASEVALEDTFPRVRHFDLTEIKIVNGKVRGYYNERLE